VFASDWIPVAAAVFDAFASPHMPRLSSIADRPFKERSWAVETEPIVMNRRIRNNVLIVVFIVDLYFRYWNIPPHFIEAVTPQCV
jgi:hypothetical protein